MDSATGISQLNILVAFSGGTLIAALTLLLKVSRFINRIEFKTEILWSDYQQRNSHSRFEINDLADERN